MPKQVCFSVGVVAFPVLLIVGSSCNPASAAEEERLSQEIVRNPDRFAWNVFAEISQPREDGSVEWERWALARLVYGQPDRPVPGNHAAMLELFEELAAFRAGPSERFEGLIQQRIFRELQRGADDTNNPRTLLDKARRDDGARFDPAVRPGMPEQENDEVRMNFETFQFVMQKELFNIEGQEAMFARGEKADFPVESKEIKAAWRKLGKGDDLDRFHTHTFTLPDGEKETWGLIALHITTKDLPNWVWATWEHESNPQREMVVPSVDRSGLKVRGGQWVALDSGDADLRELAKRMNRLPKKWTHYVLRGTQIDFVNSIGQPTLLANSVVEEGFQDTSSCITCHARAARGARLRRSDQGNMLPVFAHDDPPRGHIGTPDPSWFRTDTSPPAVRYWQMDFVWSTIRADRKSAKPREGHHLSGNWIYRAFLNDPERSTSVDELLLGKGRLRIGDVAADGSFEGRLEIDDTDPPQPLDIKGTIVAGQPARITFEGVGSGKENRDWHYRYGGYLFPDDLRESVSETPNPRLGQRPVIAGQIIRVKDHAGGEVHPAGQMGTWYMVKHRPDTPEEVEQDPR